MTIPTRPVALVTGASRGIGRAVATQLAARRVRVALHYRERKESAAAVAASLAGDGHHLFSADLEQPDAPAALFNEVLAHYGRVDLLVNCAGIFEHHPVAEVDYDTWRKAWDRTLAINLLAPTHLTFLATQHMRTRGGGRIINLSSRGAYGGQPKTSAYSASKAALNSMGHSFAQAFARERVLVFTIAPSWVDTDMAAPHIHGGRHDEIREGIPLGRVTTAEEVATTATWLALDAPEAMTGAIVDVNGAVHLRG